MNLIEKVANKYFTESNKDDSILRLHLGYFTLGLTGLFTVVSLLDLIGVSLPLVRPVLGFATAILLPGIWLLRLINLQPQFRLTWMPYIIGCGLILLMIVWLVLDLGALLIGYDQPLSPLPLLGSLLILILLLTISNYWRHDAYHLEVVRPTLDQYSPSLLLSILIAPAAILAISLLNATGNTLPIITVLIFIAAIPVLVSTSDFGRNRLAIVVWMLAIAILYHKSLWAGFTFGGHLSVVNIWEVNRWGLTGESLLPNAILMPSLAHVLGINILTQVKVVLPFIVSFLPVTLFIAFSRCVGDRGAFLGACLFVFSHPFYLQYPSVPRASMPVFFLALLALIIADDRLSRLQSRLLGLLFAFGIAVSHYGTSYYVLFAVIGALVTIKAYDMVDFARTEMVKESTAHDGGQIQSDRSLFGQFSIYEAKLLDWVFGFFYATIVIGWYLFVSAGSRFEDVMSHVIDAYIDLFIRTGSGQGSTAARLNTDYGSLSIFLAKHMYLIIAVMTGLGLAVVFLKRVWGQEVRVSDGYLALSGHLFILFGGSFILSGEWGGGRPLMIVLSFNALFMLIGTQTVANAISWPVKQGVAMVDESPSIDLAKYGHVGGRFVLAVLLAIYLLLNAGVMAAIAYEDEAPSPVPSQDIDSIHTTTDIQTHVWFTDHRAEEQKIYGDQVVWAQATDWYNGEIAARSTKQPYRFKRQNLGDLNRTGIENGYVILLGHNIIADYVKENFALRKSITAYDLDTEQRNKVYTTGSSTIYFTNQTNDN